METDVYMDLLKKCLTASIYEESAWTVIESKPLLSPAKSDMRRRLVNLLRRLVVGQLRKQSLLLVRQNRFDPAKREMGRDWPCFGYTMIGHRRLDNLEKCINTVLDENVPGDLIETGAWRGGACILMRAVLKVRGVKDRIVWVADSFQGLPIPENQNDGFDFSDSELLRAPVDLVKSNFEKFGMLDDQVRFLVGWFKETLPTAPINRLAILRLDGDLYSSTREALSNLYLKVSPGGYVIIDDYLSWPECRRAVDEFLEQNRISVSIEKIDSDSVFWRVPK